METVKMNHPNNSIKCRVKSCYFYGDGDCCTASRIEVEPRDAMSVNRKPDATNSE